MIKSNRTPNRYQLVILTLAQIRQDIKFLKLTGVVPDYSTGLEDLKRMELHYSERASELRNK